MPARPRNPARGRAGGATLQGGVPPRARVDIRVLDVRGTRLEGTDIDLARPDAVSRLRAHLGRERPGPARRGPLPEGDGEDADDPILPRLRAALSAQAVEGDPVLARFDGPGLPVEQVRVLARVAPVWVDAPVRTADDAVDLMVAGASRVVVDAAAPHAEEILGALGPRAALVRAADRERTRGEALARAHGAALLLPAGSVLAGATGGDGASLGAYAAEGALLRVLAPEPAEDE